ncbi:MAG: flagellar brake protein [Chloroflexota bacterium]
MTITLERVPLQPGQQFLLGVNYRDRREWYNGHVVSREGAVLRLEFPSEAAPALTESGGADVIIDTWRVMDARYTLRARVLTVLTQRAPQLDVELLDGTRIQHREYFRVPVSIDPRESWLESALETIPDKRIRLHLRDLSAGGLRARCNQVLNVSSTIRCHVSLPGSSVVLTLRARIARVEEEPGPTNWPCEVGASFIDLPASDREEIIQFALRLQAEDIKKGVIARD